MTTETTAVDGAAVRTEIDALKADNTKKREAIKAAKLAIVESRAGIKDNNKKIVALKKSIAGTRVRKSMTPEEKAEAKKARLVEKYQKKLAELQTGKVETADTDAQTSKPVDKVADIGDKITDDMGLKLEI